MIGEYTCIEGGPAIVGAIAPRFKLTLKKNESSASHSHPFHPDSPAGKFIHKFIKEHQSALTGFELVWTDPCSSPVGIGSSSAQFLLSLQALHDLIKIKNIDADELLHTYWKLIDQSQGLRPSGLDLCAQKIGSVHLFKNEPFYSEKIIFRDNDENTFLLAFTGSKAKTHEHLLELKSREFPRAFTRVLESLNKLTIDFVKNIHDPKNLGQIINAFQTKLEECDIAQKNKNQKYLALISEIQKWEGVYGCKGSGAQGGDCLLIYLNKIYLEDIKNKLKTLSCQPIPIEWDEDGLTQSSGW